MGKGDQRTRRGKIRAGSHGNTRPKGRKPRSTTKGGKGKGGK